MDDTLLLVLFVVRAIAILIIGIYALDDGHLPHKTFGMWQAREWLYYRFRKINWALLVYCVFNAYGVVYTAYDLLDIPSQPAFRQFIVTYATIFAQAMLATHFFFEYRWQLRHLKALE